MVSPNNSENSFIVSRWLFFRMLGVVCFIAVGSLWVQIHGLIGREGILPLQEFLTQARTELNGQAYTEYPTLFWFNDSDLAITVVCLAGLLLSLMLIVGVATRWVVALLWVVYLSLTVAGQVFLRFQWDLLLLETLFLAIFFAPRGVRPSVSRLAARPIARWALWLLLFKLMFLSGMTKLLSGDPSWQPTWDELTAMTYHYFTQPLPGPLSWHVHWLPEWFHKITAYATLAAELVVPWCIFCPRRVRHLGSLLMIGLQFGILATGNYGFFNLLTIALCVPLFADSFFARLLPRQLAPRKGELPLKVASGSGGLGWWTTTIGLSICLFVSGLAFVNELVRTTDPRNLPGWVVAPLNVADSLVLSWGRPAVLQRTYPFHTVNGYGLFRVMTKRRPEILIEASVDGVTWSELKFRWKPGDPDVQPRQCAPYMPRLDWMMWFAALDPSHNRYWTDRLLDRILEGSPTVVSLLDEPSLARPKFVRTIILDFEFAGTDEEPDAWWSRSLPPGARLQ